MRHGASKAFVFAFPGRQKGSPETAVTRNQGLKPGLFKGKEVQAAVLPGKHLFRSPETIQPKESTSIQQVRTMTR